MELAGEAKTETTKLPPGQHTDWEPTTTTTTGGETTRQVRKGENRRTFFFLFLFSSPLYATSTTTQTVFRMFRKSPQKKQNKKNTVPVIDSDRGHLTTHGGTSEHSNSRNGGERRTRPRQSTNHKRTTREFRIRSRTKEK